MSVSPASQHKKMGVCPVPSAVLMSPASSTSSAHSVEPANAARCKGVRPSASCVEGSAPASNSVKQPVGLPCTTAQAKGVRPSVSATSTAWPLYSRSCSAWLCSSD
eukprot:TRINITY_DN11880_c0_g2_i1.p5 TRINITY_DN11880_c0_g2~~TRINITY_DN11880_c0_g2_i1.p5  ORF type:complete len:106 (-),score=2.12 TRINITY_DN11880_c0_g2_i1:991-1308(-)